MYSNRLNTAVVGLGIGAQHALAMLENPYCQLSTLVDFDESKVSNFIDLHQLANIQKSTFEEVIQNKDIHLISIASFDNHHYEQIVHSLESGKHVFVEKPLCQTQEQLKHILEILIRKPCALASNLVLRTSPLYQHIKNVIKEGKLGEIYAFDGDYLYGRVNKITEDWRKDVENYSVMAGGGIHMIDLMLWLTDQKPIAVQSTANKIVTKGSAFQYHDFHSATFTFKSGLIGKINANFGCIHRHQHVVRIFGTKGTFIYDDCGARIHWDRAEDKQPSLLSLAPKPVKKAELIHEFVDKIHKQEFLSLAKREFDLMSIVFAADESLKHDRSLSVEYLPC